MAWLEASLPAMCGAVCALAVALSAQVALGAGSGVYFDPLLVGVAYLTLRAGRSA